MTPRVKSILRCVSAAKCYQVVRNSHRPSIHFWSVFLRRAGSLAPAFESHTCPRITPGVCFCNKLVPSRSKTASLGNPLLPESPTHSSKNPFLDKYSHKPPIGFLTRTTKIRAGGEGKREWLAVGCAKGCGSRGNEQQRAAETVL